VSAGSARAAGKSRPDSIRIAIQIDAATKATDTSTVAIATPFGMPTVSSGTVSAR